MPNNNRSNHSILHTIASMPGLYKWLGVAAVAVILAAWFSGGSSPHAHAPHTANPSSNPPPSMLSGLTARAGVSRTLGWFPPLPSTARGSAPAPVTSTTPVQAVQAGPLTLPAQTPVGTPIAGHARIAVASASKPPYGSAPVFQSLGHAEVTEKIASFAVMAPKPLAAVAPSAGLLRLRWSSWYQAPVQGSYTLVATIAGGNLRGIELQVDGQQSAVLSGQRSACGWNGCATAATTVAGAVMLAPDWHEVVVSATSDAGEHPRAEVTVYVRAPHAATPAALVPSWPAVKVAAP